MCISFRSLFSFPAIVCFLSEFSIGMIFSFSLKSFEMCIELVSLKSILSAVMFTLYLELMFEGVIRPLLAGLDEELIDFSMTLGALCSFLFTAPVSPSKFYSLSLSFGTIGILIEL